MAVYGPHIQDWPSGLRTLGFGREGTETAPAAAIALASVGGLAVRAAAGENDAASVLSNHGKQVGLTLHSATTHTALESVQRGGGIVPALAIAVNITDPSSNPGLKDFLPGNSGLGGLFGESVHAERSTDPKAAAVDALYYTNPEQVVDHARAAATSYTQKYYGKTLKDELLIIHAYAALARRTEALSHPNTPSAHLWLGAIVEAGVIITSRLPAGKTLESVLHEDCLDIYEAARQRGIARRPSGAAATTGGGSVPVRERSTIDATRLGVTQGIDHTGTVIRRDAGATPTSYTARKEAAGMGSRDRQYMEILTDGIRKFVECRSSQAARRQQIQEYQRRVSNGLENLYQAYPSLRPESLNRSWQADNTLLNTIATGQAQTAARHAGQLIQARQYGANFAAQISADLAAASVLHAESPASNQAYRGLLGNEIITHHAALYLLDNIDLLVVRGAAQLDPGVLHDYNQLRPADIRQRPLPSAPLHLLVLAADIVNANNTSVIPVGRPIRMSGPTLAEQRALGPASKDPSRSYAKNSWRDKIRINREEKKAAQVERQTEAEHVTSTLRACLQEQYDTPINDTRMLGFLAECAIAEQAGFNEPGVPPRVRTEMINRMYRALTRDQIGGPRPLNPAELPPAVHHMYDTVLQTMQPQSGGFLRRFKL